MADARHERLGLPIMSAQEGRRRTFSRAQPQQ
jgi:hypothetical protein